MPEVKEPNGVHWTNCEKSESFKESQPGDYKLSLQKLAELEDIKARIKELRVYEKNLCKEIYDLLPGKEMDIGGIGRVTKSMGLSRKWDHEAVFATLTARALDKRITKVDETTGEIIYREREASAVSRVLEECAYVSYWRTTNLEDYGIEIDEYCETTWTRPSVRIKN